MPTTKLFCSTTRPFNGDDLHGICLIFAVFRLMQLFGIVPLWLWIFVRNVKGSNEIYGEKPHWCGYGKDGEPAPVMYSLDDDEEDDGRIIRTSLLTSAYIMLTLIYALGDFAVLAAIWSASSIGTPTQPKRRNPVLRPLLYFKILGMNAVLAAIVGVGIANVQLNRPDHYGCGPDATRDFEDTSWYKLYCVVLFTQVFELLVWPAIIADRTVTFLKRQHDEYSNYIVDEHTRRRLAGACLDGCLKCVGLLCCFRGGGRDLGMTGEMGDAVNAFFDFIRGSESLDLVFSDAHISLRMLAKVQQQRRFECVQNALQLIAAERGKHAMGEDEEMKQEEGKVAIKFSSLFVGNFSVDDMDDMLESESMHADSDEASIESNTDGPGDVNFMLGRLRRSLVNLARNGRTQSVIALQKSQLTDNYEATVRELLSGENEDDVRTLKEAAHFAKHSEAIYEVIGSCIKDKLSYISRWVTSPESHKEEKGHTLDEIGTLEEIGMERTTIAYARLQNGIAKTPYCILVDHKWSTVIVAIRGTASLEDMVSDLQLTPSELEEVGIECGFQGKDEYCHKGVLTRCQWIHGDIKRHRVLEKLLLAEEPRCPGYQLIITGHSLGAGCAAVLSTMMRSQFPALRCYAFCPPGGLISAGLADSCKEYVTSIVNNADVIPRTSLANLERLRDESFEILARIKIPKMIAYRILNMSCEDKYLAELNAKLLYPADEVPKDTEYSHNLEKFFALKQEHSETISRTLHIPLHIPGKIVFLIPTEQKRVKCAAQWAFKEDFNEIIMTNTLADDHSIIVVRKNLDLVNAFLERKDEDDSVEEEEDEKMKENIPSMEDFQFAMRLEKGFICCSKPHGNYFFAPSVLGTCAWWLSLVGNNFCAFVSRTTTITGDGADGPGTGGVLNGIDILTGLYNFEMKYHDGDGDSLDGDAYVGGGVCHSYPEDFEPDALLRLARASGTLCLILGGGAIISLWFAACVSYRRCSWHLMTAGLGLATLFQGLVFVLLRSELCSTYHFPGDERYNIAAFTVDGTCEIAWAGIVSISALCIWFVTAFSTFKYIPPRMTTGHFFGASAHPMSMNRSRHTDKTN